MLANHKIDDELQDLRSQIRCGAFTRDTSGLAPGLVQGNLVILPAILAEEFLHYCHINPTPCPVIGSSQPGNPSLPMLGRDLDIRVDVPEYYIFENGDFSASVSDIKNYWQDDSVAIVLGCSYSFEEQLISSGYSIRNVDKGVNVSMYDTNIPTASTEHFSGNTVVSMRPFKQEHIKAVTAITARFPKTHGAPIHIGDPGAIGISNINQPEYGDAVFIAKDEVPVFWGCGVTSQLAVKSAKIPLVITHAPGKMLITGIRYNEL